MKIEVSRGTVVPFESLPSRSIALDGYVQGPQIDVAQQRFSFDHHAGCIRHCTKSTCEQVLDALVLGLDPEGFTVFVNDVDADTALAVWLLENPKQAKGDPVVAELVRAVGLIDAHGPAYALPLALDRRATWFFDGVMLPEREARKNRTYGTIDLADLLRVCVARVDRWNEELGRPDVVEYEITHRGAIMGVEWVLAKSRNFVFNALYKAGHVRAVAYDQLPDGSYAYTIAKASEFIADFPVGPHTQEGTLLHALNEVEPGWGGASTIGGAPRNADGSRSRLHPDQVYEIMCSVLAGAWR